MKLKENISLKAFNTFGIDAKARYFSSFSSVDELAPLLTPVPINIRTRLPTLILGGGSNILFIKDFNGLVLKNEVMRIQKIKEDDKYVYVKAGAGENWHRFVIHCI